MRFLSQNKKIYVLFFGNISQKICSFIIMAAAPVSSTYKFDICTVSGDVIDATEIKKIKDSLWDFRIDTRMENDGGPFKHLFPPNTFISFIIYNVYDNL